MKRLTKPRHCATCRGVISQGRLFFLPQTRTCVRCSVEEKDRTVQVDGSDQADMVHVVQDSFSERR